VGGFVLHGLGVAIALYEGAPFDFRAWAWGQFAVTAIQVMTHYSNDYFDLEADRANLTPTRWSGGSRMLPEGQIAPGLALAAALLAALLALVAALVVAFALRPGPLALPLLLLALVLGWSYSSPPLTLHSSGIGELAGAFLIAGLTPLVGHYLQAGELSLLPWLAIIPLVLLQVVMLVLIQFPDRQGDAAAGKETLVVRLGAPRAVRLVQLVLALFFLLLPLLVAAGLPMRVAVALAIFTFPATLWLFYRLRQGRWADQSWWNWLGITGVGLVVGAATVSLAAFLALAGG
jgi:1,4-dihydroxy-2-naphthoate octaprenyltransferase